MGKLWKGHAKLKSLKYILEFIRSKLMQNFKPLKEQVKQ